MNDGEARESRLASGWTVEGSGAQESAEPVASGASADDAVAPAANETDETETGDERGQVSNAALVILGVFGGVYLMYSWVWLSWARASATANNLAAASSGSLGGVLQQVVFWAAPLAPIGWFLCVMLLNKGASTLRLAFWIVVGAVVLVPLPMFIWGN